MNLIKIIILIIQLSFIILYNVWTLSAYTNHTSLHVKFYGFFSLTFGVVLFLLYQIRKQKDTIINIFVF
jgi:hypothetical protein